MDKKKFGFLVHPRDRRDYFNKFPYVKWFPDFVVDFMTKHGNPVLVSKITGLRDANGEDVEGHIIAITMTAKQMLEDREQALKQIMRAVEYAKKKGVGLIGFGALTASLSRGGLSVGEQIEGIGITTGRAYTVKTVTGYAKKCITDFGFNKETVKVGIVGAAGSIGSGSAKILARWGVKNFVLVDLERKLEAVEDCMDAVVREGDEPHVTTTHKVHDIRGCDIIIAATNAPEVIITSRDLKPGALVINDAQPSDVSPDIITNRNDVLVIEGGVIRTSGIKCNFNLGLVSPEDTFCCLGEILVLAHHHHFKDFALGELNLDLIDQISEMSEGVPLQLAPFQNAVGEIPEAQIKNVRRIIESNRS